MWLGYSECFPKAIARSLPTGLCKVFNDSLPNEKPASPADTAKTTSTTIVIAPIPLPKDSLVKDSDLVVVPPDVPKPAITYNVGCSVGTIGGSLAVGGLGSAVYNLKIETPDGGSLTPQIGLAYDSQSGGYGLAGYGFNITGISAITRGGHDMFHDGRQSGVTYTASDNLYLDGKRLILQSGTAGQDGSVYTVEGDPFTKVVTHVNCDTNTATIWFEVTTRTGMTYEYGNSSTSRLTYTNKSGLPRIASWYISSANDRYANHIYYEYETSNLCVRPTVITYGVNSSQGRGIVNQIKFSYRSLGDKARPFMLEDQQGRADMCLSSLVIMINNSVFRQYTFTYDDESNQSDGKWVRLVSVEEKNGKGDKLPPVNFTWEKLTSPIIRASELDVATKDSHKYVEESDQHFLSVDLNGDGISDIVRVSQVQTIKGATTTDISYGHSTNVYVYKGKVTATGNITYEFLRELCLPAGVTINDYKVIPGAVSAMDFDGDGYNDLVLPYFDTSYGCNQAIFRVLSGYDITTGAGGPRQLPSIKLKSTNRVPLYATYDIDGDGKDEIVCVEQQRIDGYYPCTIVQYKGDISSKCTEVRLTLPLNFDKEIEKVFVGDYNNDGLQDLILLYDGGYKIYFNNGGTDIASRFSESNTRSGTGLASYWRMQQGDFDGDGLSDFVYNKKGESCLWIAHNNGDGTFAHARTIDIGVADHSSAKDDGRFSLMAYDVDHDGRTDVMVCKAGYEHRGLPKFENQYTNTQVKWFRSTGSDLELLADYTKGREDDAVESYLFLGDFDGDGGLELANYGSLLNSTSDVFNEKINIYKVGGSQAKEGKITAVSDGMANSQIEYASLTDTSVYRTTLKNSYPVSSYTPALSVVKSITNYCDYTGNLTTQYSYEDLRLHIGGRGMLGFNGMITKDITLDTEETHRITRWDEDLWIPTETKLLYTVGTDTSTTVSTYAVSKTGNNYFSYLSNKEVTDLDGNRTTTESHYDVEKGVVTDETVRNDDCGDMYKRVEYSGYQEKAGIWVPTTLTMTQKHADDPTPHTIMTTYSYDDRGNVVSTTLYSGTDMELTTASTYDVYGNVLSSVTTGNGVRPIIKYNDYDASGRFVIKSYSNPEAAVNTYTYDLWGNLLTESDATEPSNILTTRYTYDGWGRRLATQQANGTRTTYKTGWGHSPKTVYYTEEAATGRPPVKTWYDWRRRETSVETFGVKGLAMTKTTTYNDKGHVSRVVNKTGKLSLTQDMAYDERGRVVKEVHSSGKTVAYAYGNRSVTTTLADRSYTKTYDAWGNVVKSTDPVSEVTYRYASIGKPVSVTTQGAIVAMAYDEAGNRLSLTDPDAGTTTYTYAADGTLLTQTDARGVKTAYTYDNLGRVAATRIGQSTIANTYGTTGNAKMRLTRQSMGGNSIEYTYDQYGRVATERRNVEGKGNYSFAYAYNDNNQLAKTTYPGGLEVAYQYDKYGYKSQSAVGDRVIYKVEGADGLVSSSSFLGRLTATRTLDSRGYECRRNIAGGSIVLDSIRSAYDGNTGNLLTNQRCHQLQQIFSYDDLDRLVSVKVGSIEHEKVDYAPNGNILFKKGVGNYSYDASVRPHAVTEVENAEGQIPNEALNTTFNDFGKIDRIEDTGKNLWMDFVYGPGQQRWYTELLSGDTIKRSTIYADTYEKTTEDGTIREFYYLDGNTIVVRENGETKYFLAFTDHLGSILSVTDEDGNSVFDATYDAWGKQTVLHNYIGLHRGYTGHEMLNEFGIINMNGRLYDPVLGRFFSPDNYVQMPDNSQNFNRYSYCLNNPLKYTDPSGNTFMEIFAFAMFNMASSMMQAGFEGKNVWKAGALSLASSAASYGIGELFQGVGTLGHELLRAGAHGLASGAVSALDGGNFGSAFVAGTASSAIGSYAQSVSMNTSLMVASTTVMGGVMAWATGGEFLQGAMQGMKIGLFNHALHEGDGDIRYSHDRNGNIVGEIPEVEVVASRSTGNDLLGTAALINTIFDGLGKSLKNNSGESTFGSNNRLYWHGENGHGFYGNQYVSTVRLAHIGNRVSKVTGYVGLALDGMEIYNGYQLDGARFGYHSVRATASVASKWAGASTGAWFGAKVGAMVGGCFGGVGAVPGAIVGGAVGGMIGSECIGELGEMAFDRIYVR